nr:unnamed protein product [Callosobruchus chinensis]
MSSGLANDFVTRFTISIFSISQSLASTIQTSTAVESKEIDIIVKVVNALEKLGDAALDIATKIVDYSIKNVHDLPKEISAHAGKFLNKISAVIVKVLEIVKKNVNKDASVVVTCTEALSKDFATNYGTTVKDTLECVDPNLEKVLVIIPDVLKQLGAILKKVEGVTANLNKCAGGPLKEIACLLDVSTSNDF